MLFGEPRTPLLLLAADEPHGVLPHIQLFSSLNGIMYAVDINPSGALVSLAVQEEEKHKMSMLGGWGGGRQRSPAGDSINLLCKYLIQLVLLLQHQSANHSCLAGS